MEHAAQPGDDESLSERPMPRLAEDNEGQRVIDADGGVQDTESHRGAQEDEIGRVHRFDVEIEPNECFKIMSHGRAFVAIRSLSGSAAARSGRREASLDPLPRNFHSKGIEEASDGPFVEREPERRAAVEAHYVARARRRTPGDLVKGEFEGTPFLGFNSE